MYGAGVCPIASNQTRTRGGLTNGILGSARALEKGVMHARPPESVACGSYAELSSYSKAKKESPIEAILKTN